MELDPWLTVLMILGLFAGIIVLGISIPNQTAGVVISIFALLLAGGGVSYMFSSGILVTDFQRWTGGAGVFASMLAILFVLSGPIIDIINGEYKYSKATFVGVFGSAIAAMIGSNYFVQFSKGIMSYIYPVSDSSWWFRLLNVWVILAVGLLVGPPVAFEAMGQSKNATIYSIICGGIYAAILFAGGLGDSVAVAAVAAADAAADAVADANPFNAAPAAVADAVPEANPFRGGFKGGNELKLDPDVCDVPGFTILTNSVAPASIVLTQTIIWCHLIEAFVTGSGGDPTASVSGSSTMNNSWALGLTSLITFGLQWGLLSNAGCLDRYTYKAWSPLIAYALSIVFAGTAYVVLKPTAEGFTNDTPKPNSGIFSNPISPTKPTKKSNQTKIKVSEPDDMSAPVDDTDQFVCEAYRDGELVTSTIVE